MENGSNLLLNTSVLYRSMQKFYDRRLSKYELGSGQLPFLLYIYEHEGITMQQLAQIGSYDKGTITRGIVKLEEQGYIQVQIGDADKRIRHLYTTGKTKDIISDVYLIRREWWEQVSDGMTQADMEHFEYLQECIAAKAKDLISEEHLQTRIYGLQKLTLLDYPGKVSCTMFTGGCNFRCPYCQNRDLVFLDENMSELTEEDLTMFLKKRKGILDGVCISGGEPLLQPNIEAFLTRIKELGYQVKLDTNGSQPEKMKDLIEAGLLDYVAMDVKNGKYRYAETIGVANFDLSAINESIRYLKEAPIDYEFRTTVVQEFHNEEDIIALSEWLKGGKILYLQQFVESERVIRAGLHAYDEATMQHLADLAAKNLPAVVRGV